MRERADIGKAPQKHSAPSVVRASRPTGERAAGSAGSGVGATRPGVVLRRTLVGAGLTALVAGLAVGLTAEAFPGASPGTTPDATPNATPGDRPDRPDRPSTPAHHHGSGYDAPAHPTARGGTIGLPLPTTATDFLEKGTQPGMLQEPIASFNECTFCHADPQGDPLTTLPNRWQGSLHAHSAKDPLFWAAVTIANQDAAGSGETCIRCHAPKGWLEGRSSAPDGSALIRADYEAGINCNFCHRNVDPVYDAGVDPLEDEAILWELETDPSGNLVPTEPGNAQYVVDPLDLRRGPRTYGPDESQPLHAWRESPFHRSANMCGTCHDVSNPVYSLQPDGSYDLNAFDEKHPTGSKHDMLPEQRTFSEWANSAFAQGEIDVEGRFGGNRPTVSSCQDCHMPDVTGSGTSFGGFPIRPDLAYHSFAGANRWMVDVLKHVYQEPVLDDQGQVLIPALTQIERELLDIGKADAGMMLTNATETEVTQSGGQINVRVTNWCGHKLLTGFPEGRRIWINVQFLDAADAVIAERGFYDMQTAELTEDDTKVYEIKLGIDADAAAATGLPEGPSFHQVLVNEIVKDNRIPPMGFTNAAFEAVGAPVVGAEYADGQHWDDTRYCIPAGAAKARVRLYYQTASKEYIEFLRDTNVTDDRGQVIYDAWLATGKSEPFAMDDITVSLANFVAGDIDGNSTVDVLDLNLLLGAFNQSAAAQPGADVNCDGVVDVLDLNTLLSNFNVSTGD